MLFTDEIAEYSVLSFTFSVNNFSILLFTMKHAVENFLKIVCPRSTDAHMQAWYHA